MQFVEKAISKRSAKTNGLTVLEVMIVLAAIGIVVLIAVPGSSLFLDKHRMKVSSDSIIMGLELARSEARARGSAVVLCPSSNSHTCRSDGDWNYGWIVFSDGNGNGTVQDIELIQAFGAPSQNIRIKADGALQKRAAFTATGLIANGNFHSGQFQICLQDSKNPATLVKVDADGWVQKIPNPDGACVNG